MSAQTGIIVLPKLSIDGKAKMTSILASEITGVEPCTMHYQGKQYQGTKCYTVHGSSFKVFSDPSAMVQGWHLAKNNPAELVNMVPLKQVAGYTEVKALPSGKKVG